MVLDTFSDGSALLISQKILAFEPFNEAYSKTEWAKCTLRTWLNGEFLKEAFTSSEQSQMKDWVGGDRVTLLSREEAEQYSSILLTLEDFTTMADFSKRVHYGKSYDAWWLRSSGDRTSRAVLIMTESSKELVFGTVQVDAGAGIRPVICIKLQ